MKKIFTHLFALFLLSFVSASAWAQLTELEVGKVYRFVSARADRSLAADGTDDVHVKETNAADTKQEWYVTKDGDYYVLRNVACGKYLKGAYSAYTSWSMTDDYSDEYNKFELYTSNSTLNTLKTKGSDGYGYMHDDNNGDNGGYNVVGWLNGNTNTGSHWTITKVDYTSDEITALLEKAPTVAEIEAYITSLEALFTDTACVTPALGSLSAAQATEAYNALPATLKAMVDKVYNEKTEGVALETAWAEDNADAEKEGWSGKYAKKFRVQMYEPYSIAGDITSWLGINAHANNDNPTGIHVPEAGTLYVMVEGTINDGASLRIVDGGHNWRVTNATGGGYALKPGLNVINYTGTAGQLYICYNVDTYNPDGTDDATRFPHKLSEYAPLKIHIEGGAIAGYYNACGDFRATAPGAADDLWYQYSGASVDCDADWEYMETRANLNVLPVLGHRQILLFHLEDWEGNRGMKTLLPDLVDVPTEPYSNAELWSGYDGMGLDASTGKINIMMEAWDRIMYSELATMGLVSEATMKRMNELYPRWENDYTVKHEMYDYENKSSIDGKDYLEFCGVDYSDVFNHHGVALGTESGYMYGGWDHCGYHINTYGGIVQNMANNAGSTWGPAHEIGHQHQALLTLNGLTEVTNNLFSNIALWYKGMSTSRYNGSNGSLESVLNAYNTEGSDIYTNNIWALTHLYYRLWLYYHLAGNNTQFYPRLFELLRHEPMQKGYNVSGDVSTLHFYKLACQAAGEDLTEFFRAHGYFSIMDDRLVGDYSNSVYEVSQEMIDEAIAEVKEMGYEENLAIIFICDDDENATYVQHDGVTKRDIYGETTSNSDFGSVSDFINGNVSVDTTYTATLNSDGTLTMSGGEGGVGFLVLNEDGEIVSFSNKSTFALSDEAAYLLATGKASVVTVDTESTTTEAEVDVTAMRFALLQELIENAIALTQNTSETRVGFYKSSAVTNLQGYVTDAQEVIANGDLANLQAVYELLYNEYNAVVANEFSRVTLVPGSKFAIISVKSNDRILTYSDSNVTTVSGNADAYSSTDAYQWYIERDGAYYIKNAGTSKYIQDVTDQNGVLYTVGDNKVNMNINEVALGCYTIATSNVPGRYMNMDGADAARIITWGDAYSENSQWAFILLEADDTNKAKEELLELSKKTLALVNEVATVSYNEGSKISLQSSSSTTANYIWSNAAVSGNDVDKLLDSDKNTFFHSQWNNSTAPTDGWGHHLTVDLGEDPSLTSFKFKFTTRNTSNLSNYPKTIEVYGSNVGGDDVANYTKLQVASGFATGAGVDNEALVMGNGTAYRYLRFLVTDATGNNSGTNTGSDGMVFFHMSEFSIYPVTVSATVKSDYTSGVTVDAVLAAYNDAEQDKTVYNNASATLADINAKKTALGDGTAAGSYTTLLTQYNNVLNSVLEAKKTELLTLITNTDSLIKTVGSVEFTDVPFALTTENLYCNDPCLRNDDDYSADYVTKLTDGNHSTYLHTDWDGSNPAGSAPHYLRVDMGEGETITQFKFSYTTRNNGNNCPTTIVVEGSNDAGGNGTYTTITTLTKDANGLPDVYATFNSETITSTVPYRYIRFRVTATESGDSFFVMSEFSFTKANQPVVTMTNTSTKADEALVFDTYLATAKSQKLHDAATTVALLDAAIADQQAAYDALEKAKNTPADLDKAALQSLYGDALQLYNEMADTEGNVNTDYTPSALTNEKLIEVKAALDVAKEMLDNGISQTEIDAAKTTLQEQYDALLVIKNANVNLSGTFDKSELGTLITNAAALLSTINGKTENNNDYYAAAGIAIDELQDAYNAAVAAKDRYYLTAEQYTAVKDALNNSYTTINPIVAADVAGRDELTTLIDNVKTLLGTIADESAPKNVAVPLQSTAADGNFYIWCNSPAGDDDGVAGLIDKNADGTANTGTFLGTSWGSTVAAYTHYIEVDLGEGITIDKLLFDYTTRNSTHSNQRPTAIKILGSNDKTDYTEITIISEGLATEQCQQWSMAETLELGAPYRYIRFAVATQESTGYFNMSDFNLYALIGHTRALKEYYTTAEGLELDALCIALQSAEYAAEHYLTTDRLTEVKNMLNGYYTAANTIVEADVEAGDRTDLTGLVAETETLIEKVATVTEVEVTLTEGMLYCNADNSTNGSAGDNDKRGVAALLDGDVTTHLHTTYGGNAQDDDLDHYIRVDMGDDKAVAAFEFSYTGRSSNSGNDPSTIIIQGCNTVDGEWVDIKTLTNLPTDGDKVQYSSGLIEASEAYRYIRFMVTETENNSYTTYNDIQHKFFVMSEFSFTAYPTVEINENYPNVTTALVRAAYNEKNSANNVATNYYMTESDHNAALEALQADYDALDAAATADKSELEALIEATTILKGQLYETVITSYTANEVTLSITEGEAGYIYCNAPEKNSTWATDNVGVAALIDLTDGNPNLETFLHTEYGNDQSADGLDHYLRVDLGADGATEYIEFGYFGRSSHEAKSPKKVIVAATNDLTDGGEWTTIATLNPAQASATAETKTGCLGNGVAYRYWRFLVEETHGGGKDGNNHQFFCMTQFNVYKCTDIVKDEQLKYTPNIYIYTTSELVTEVENAISAATTVKDNAEALQSDVDAAVEALQAVYDKLAEALRYANAPVEITTDEANPILYNIISKRADDGSKVLQYCEFDAENPKTVSVSGKAANNSYQAWYFMESVNGYYFIKPFNGDGKVLGADNTGDGDTKVWAVAEDEKSYDEWNFVARADGYYNIQAYDCSNYFSNKGGVDFKMGFWSGSPESDGGSLFKFVKATFENDNARYYQLSDFENTLEYQTADTPEGTTVGAFVNGSAYSEAYTAASTLITAGNTSDATACREAYTALRTASEDVERIEPEEGKIYRIYITPGYTAIDRAGASMRIDDNGKLYCDTYAESNARFYFTFEYDDDGNLYMKNLHTCTYLDEALNSTDNKNVQVGADAETIDTAKKITINTLGKSGDAVVVGIVPDGGDMLNCAGKPGDVVAFNNTAVDKASAWVITEVDEISGVVANVVHSVSLGADESGSGKAYSTLYLGYNATIPEGVTASVVTEINEIGQLVMEEVVGDILPAKTAVVLSGEKAGDAEFKYADGEPNFSTEDNILKGTSYTKLENCGNSHNIYMLGKKSGRVAFYRAYENRNASGDKVTVEGMGTNHNESGYVKCNANKAYLMVPEENAQAAAAMFSFFMGGNTTDLESINAVADTYDNVYDLQGRKHTEITEPGMYIVGGKKVLVK